MNAVQSSRIPRDRTLTQLATALDPQRMQSAFQKHFDRTHTCRIAECRIERIKYKPGKNCHVCYRLLLRHGGAKEGGSTQLVSARFYEPGGSASRFRKASGDRPGRDTGRDLVLHIPELDCIAWIFPSDRKLDNLDRITDSDFLAETVLPELFADHFGASWSIVSVRSEMIRYVPEHTCSVRADIEMVHASTEVRRSIIAYGKTYYNEEGRRTDRIMRQLWCSPPRYRSKLNIPQPIGYQPRHRLFWQLEVPGVPLSQLCAEKTLFLDGVAQAARQVALLHGIGLEHRRQPGQMGEEPLRQLSKTIRLFDGFESPFRAQVNALIARLTALMPAAPRDRLALLHGDLHLKNILSDGSRTYLIDLDNCAAGDPLQDVGSFIAAMLTFGVTGALPQPLVDETIRVFLKNYGTPFAELRLRWHVAAALVGERVFRSVTRLKSGRLQRLGDLIDLASSILEGGGSPEWLRPEHQVGSTVGTGR